MKPLSVLVSLYYGRSDSITLGPKMGLGMDRATDRTARHGHGWDTVGKEGLLALEIFRDEMIERSEGKFKLSGPFICICAVVVVVVVRGGSGNRGR